MTVGTQNSGATAKLIAEHQANPYRRSGPDSDCELWSMCWRHSQPGNRLPAEPGVVVIEGGRR